MANALSMPDFNAAVQGGFQQGQSMAQQGVRRNALSSIAGALNENDYASAGNAAAQLGDPELVLQIKTLKQQGEQAKIDTLKAKAGAIRETLAIAEQYRMSNPGNFPQVAQGLATQFVQMNPELGYSPEQVLQTLLDPAQGQAALASVMGIEGAISQANTEFEQELKLRDADRKDRQQDETERKNRVSEDLQRQTLDQQGQARQAKIDADSAKKADDERAANLVKAQLKAKSDETLSLIDELRNHEGFHVAVGAGFRPVPFGGLPGFPRRDFETRLKTLKTQMAWLTLGDLKVGNKAGSAGLGALSDREFENLAAARGNLDTTQSEEQFLNVLNTIETSIRNIRAIQGLDEGGDLSSLEPRSFEGLTKDEFEGLTKDEFEALTIEEFKKLTPDQKKAFREAAAKAGVQ